MSPEVPLFDLWSTSLSLELTGRICRDADALDRSGSSEIENKQLSIHLK